MYKAFFSMKHAPFTNRIPVDNLYLSDAVAECLGRLCYAAENQLFAVVTAEVGCGKTTLIRRLSASLNPEEYLVLYLSDSQLTPRWFYNGLLHQLGAEGKFYRGDAKLSLHQQLEYMREVKHKKVLTIVDEAHLLKRETVEEIRFMLNYQMDSKNPMALILVGQNELWDKLSLQAYAAVRQRIDLKCSLPLLDRAQTESYIKAHLVYADGQQDIFTDKAIDEIYQYSSGTFRSINKICMHSLLSAAQRSKKLIDDHLIHLVVESELP